VHVDPVEYLTLDQFSLLQDLYARDVAYIQEKANAMIPGPSSTRHGERPYLPTLWRAPKSLCNRLQETISSPKYWKGRNPEIRDATFHVVAGWEANTPTNEARPFDENQFLSL
jgi:hypothetical protein